MSTQESFYDQVIELAKAKGCRFRNDTSEITLLQWLWTKHRIHIYTKTNEVKDGVYKFQYVIEDKRDKPRLDIVTKGEPEYIISWEALFQGIKVVLDTID
jgi:hypothetical protein